MTSIRSGTIRGLALYLALAATHANAQQPSLVEKGKILVDAVAACGNCHTPRDDKGGHQLDRWRAGGVRMPIPQSTVYGSNITPDPETGIGEWSDEQIVRAIREGVRPDGSTIGPPMPFFWYRQIADEDMRAMVAYLRSLPPVRNAVPPAQYSFQLPAGYGPPITTVSPPHRDPVDYGRYLAGPVAHCLGCHTGSSHAATPEDLEKRLGAGGRSFGPGGIPTAPNLTPHETGLKGWTDAEIERAVRKGLRRDGSVLKPPMPFVLYERMPPAEMQAIIAYLRALKPVAFGGK